MIPLRAFLSFFLSLPLIFTADHTKIYHSGHQLITSVALPGIAIIVAAKIFNYCFSITHRSLAWMYRNNHRALFKILAYISLRLDLPFLPHTHCLLNACMWEAIENKENEKLSFLLGCGADPNLIYAPSSSSDFPDSWYFNPYFLIKHKKKNHKSITFLTYACQKNNTEQAKILLQNNANPDADHWYFAHSRGGSYHFMCIPKNVYYHENPLLIACYFNNSDIIKSLVHHNTKTHPFRDRICLEHHYDDAKVIMPNKIGLFTPHDTDRYGYVSAYVSAIDLAMCHENRDMFDLLVMHTLEKNNSFSKAQLLFIRCALYHTNKIKSLFGILPSEIKNTIWDKIVGNIKGTAINRCFERDETVWITHNQDINIHSQEDQINDFNARVAHLGFNQPKTSNAFLPHHQYHDAHHELHVT